MKENVDDPSIKSVQGHKLSLQKRF